jgi:hypothetical protein
LFFGATAPVDWEVVKAFRDLRFVCFLVAAFSGFFGQGWGSVWSVFMNMKPSFRYSRKLALVYLAKIYSYNSMVLNKGQWS